PAVPGQQRRARVWPQRVYSSRKPPWSTWPRWSAWPKPYDAVSCAARKLIRARARSHPPWQGSGARTALATSGFRPLRRHGARLRAQESPGTAHARSAAECRALAVTRTASSESNWQMTPTPLARTRGEAVGPAGPPDRDRVRHPLPHTAWDPPLGTGKPESPLRRGMGRLLHCRQGNGLVRTVYRCDTESITGS